MLRSLIHKNKEDVIFKILDSSFYRSVYGTHLKKKKPAFHFASNISKAKFDPAADINLVKLSEDLKLSAWQVVKKLSSDDSFYKMHRSISPAALEFLGEKLSEKQLKDLKTCSMIIDEKYYLQAYPDVARTWLKPHIHYFLYGAKEGRKPVEWFDSGLYLELYDDVAKKGLNPFVHYFESGKAEGRIANKKEKNIAETEERLKSNIERAAVFDSEYYLQQNLDVKEAGIDPYLHYIENGEGEGRYPNQYFSPNFYWSKNPDVKEAGLSALHHFLEFGASEGREYGVEDTISKTEYAEEDDLKPESPIEFSADYYLETYLDIKEAGADPWGHFTTHGEAEGRQPNAYFDPSFYNRLNADVRIAGISAFEHFATHGYYEGRLGIQPELTKRSNARKPLLFVGHDGIQAGSEVVLLEIVKWFYQHTNRRIKVLLLSPGPMANEYAKYSETYVLSNFSIDNKVELGSFIDEQFEFAYINTVVAGQLFPLLASQELKLKGNVVVHIHEMEKVIEENRASFDELRNHAIHYISASPASTETLISKYEIPETKVTTVPAFIRIVDEDLSNLDNLKQFSRNELGLEQKSFVVAGCGTVYWRKGPDIFLETARQVLAQTKENIQFVWIGPGPDLDQILESLSGEEKARIKFVGNKTNANELLAAADLFFMSSREDPFPLVVMEAAQHKVPSICFAETTGIKAFIQNDAGSCLPTMETEGAAAEIIAYAEDRDLLARKGLCARERVTDNYTTAKQCMNIFNTISSFAGYEPSVTVAVPFYNHENFVEERVNSILNQSIKDIEVMLMDDCSKDNTIGVAKQFEADERVVVIENEKNSGTPFAQWKKGLEHGRAKVTWIAEGDDTCDENFIATLLPYFDDPMVNIASGKTEIINQYGELQEGVLDPYLNSARVGKYQQSFVLDGFKEVDESFGAVCTLVNASGLLLRSSSISSEILEQATSYKMCGDWLVYLSCLVKGKLAYDVSTHNYFRRHTESVVNKIEGTSVYFDERFRISNYVVNNFNISNKLLRRAFEAIDGEWQRFKFKHEGKELADLYDKESLLVQWQSKRLENKKHVAFYVHGMLFSKGGIERLMADIANYLTPKGYEVTIYCRIWADLTSPVYPLYESVNVVPIFDENKQEQSIINLRQRLLADNVDLFIPMLSEWLFAPIVESAKNTGIPVIASEHNDPWKIEELWWNHDERVKCFASVDKIHLLLNKFTESLPDSLQEKVSLIPNGIDLPKKVEPYENREKLIVGVGRLAEQKRFDRLIDATAIIQDELREEGWRIEIYGDGHLRQELTEQIESNDIADLIFLMGLTDDIGEVLNRAAINVMPSEFEGFGIALVEAMAHGVPSIAFEECNGPNEIIEHGISGYLVSDSKKLANKINDMIIGKEDLLNMSIESKKKAYEYSKEAIFPLWESIIKATS